MPCLQVIATPLVNLGLQTCEVFVFQSGRQGQRIQRPKYRWTPVPLLQHHHGGLACVAELRVMKEERVPASASFKFLDYQPQEEVSSTIHSDPRVTHNAFWSYCGPILKNGDDLPPNFHEWAHAALSNSLVPRLIPFLRFVNKVLKNHELDHYWLTIRATKATSEFDQPRWHTDDMFFSARGGGLRAIPREDGSTKAMDLQTDWKLCTTLLGPSTMFIPAERQAEARETQRSTRKALATDHECTSIRCVACAATSDAVRERLSIDLKHMGVLQAAPGECGKQSKPALPLGAFTNHDN